MRHFAAVTLICSCTLIGCAQGGSSATSPQAALLTQAEGVAGQRLSLRLKDNPCATVLAPTVPISPGVVRQLDVGTCKLSRLGTVDFVSDKVLQLALGTQTIQATLPWAFPYQGGGLTNTLWVCSNGWVSLQATTSTDSSETVAELLSGPTRVFGMWDDLDPSPSSSRYRVAAE